MRHIKILLIVALLSILVGSASAATGTAGAVASAFCGGSGGTGGGGVIPSTNILSGTTNGVTSLLTVSVFIMLVMLMVMAILYIISYVAALPVLKNMVKQEVGEIVITILVVALILGSFNLGAATATTGTHIPGVNVGQQTFIDDCTYLATASVNLFIPYIVVNIIQFLLDTVESLKLTITPAYFGVVITPLQGFDLFDQVLMVLGDVTGGMILLIASIAVALGFIYGVFPIFLYAGIILRTIPWTRAAGGAFLGLFIGFYIVFPLLLHALLSGYIGTISTAAINSNPTVVQAYINGLAAQSASGGSAVFSASINALTQAATLFIGTTAGGSYGLINGYIFFILEPAFFTIIAIVLSLMISFDFAELAGDLLGAPNLRGDTFLAKVV